MVNRLVTFCSAGFKVPAEGGNGRS
jgi:hypothetical protein